MRSLSFAIIATSPKPAKVSVSIPLAELRKRMPQVDDLVEPRLEEIVLPAVSPLLRPHRITLPPVNGGRESRPAPPFNLQEIKLLDGHSLQKTRLAYPSKTTEKQRNPDTSRTTFYFRLFTLSCAYLRLLVRLGWVWAGSPRAVACTHWAPTLKTRDSISRASRFPLPESAANRTQPEFQAMLGDGDSTDEERR